MGDTFTFSVHNPAEANMDITSVTIANLDGSNYVVAVEDGTVNFDETVIAILPKIKNLGEEAGTATVTLKDGTGNPLEQKSVDLDGGQERQVSFDNGGSGYSLPDGETKSYTVEVTP